MEELILGRAQDVIVREELLERLHAGEKLRVKLGIDPTGPRLHLGRVSTLRRIRQLQDLGHKVVLIIGDRTAIIGDASDKTSERQPLTAAQVQANMTSYLDQLGKVIHLKQAEVRYNSEWLDKLTSIDFIQLTQNFTVAQMIERENFSQRYREQRPIGLHEFLYPALQGYDSVAIKADVETGGTDQLFNLMAGRVLQKAHGQRPQHVMTFDLLTGPDGRKMSTSWGNTIYPDDAPAELYGKIMSVKDELVAGYYRICTDIELGVVDELVKTLADGANPRDSKASLAREIVRLYHGEEAALAGEAAWNQQFRDGGRPEEIADYRLPKRAMELVDILTESGMASSKSEARRLITQGGVKLDDVVMQEEGDGEAPAIKDGTILQVGKRRYLKLRVTG